MYLLNYLNYSTGIFKGGKKLLDKNVKRYERR